MSLPIDPQESANTGENLRVRNLTLAAFAGLSGCFTVTIIVAALLIGLWLDAHFQQRGPFTIGLLLLSFPISLFVMVRTALGSVKSIRTQPLNERHQESNTEEG